MQLILHAGPLDDGCNGGNGKSRRPRLSLETLSRQAGGEASVCPESPYSLFAHPYAGFKLVTKNNHEGPINWIIFSDQWCSRFEL